MSGMDMRRAPRLATLAAALVTAAAGAAAAETIRVTMKGLRYLPAEITVHLGDTMEWVNQDLVAHTATARSKDWEVTVPPGEVGRLLIEKASEADYFCRFHPNMTARITVVDD